MNEQRSIPRKPSLPPAADFDFLRAEGLRYVQALSGQIWTDHNSHDPGITILEILSYALTDLAYRTSFPTEDLLTGPGDIFEETTRSALPPAHEVLTTGPRTIADYRRLLLRIDGVRNAWLDPMADPEEPGNYRLSEVPIYADCLADKLSYDARNAAGDANHPVKISGLYKVLVEFEIDEELGSLNEEALIYRVRHGPLKGMVVAFDCEDQRLRDGMIDARPALTGIGPISVTSGDGVYIAEVTLALDNNTTLTLANCAISIIEDKPRANRPPLTINANRLRAVILDDAADGLVPLFWKKQRRRQRTLTAVRRVLHAHRGLCEDFLSIGAVRPYRIGICADIEVSAEANLERVQAAAYFAIEQYLAAPVRYRTLADMLADGYRSDQIFNGPFIDYGFTVDGEPVFSKAGFITDKAIEASALRRQVRASDIINLIVDIDGVEAIRDVQLRAYDAAGIAIGASENWLLDVPPDHQPSFAMPVSKILFHKAGIPYIAQPTELRRTLDELRARHRQALYVPPDQTLPLPTGRSRNLGHYESIQHDFPETYKIGRARISPRESDERIARARQLKGYLAFFDQLLADYLAQLANLRKLYSLDGDLSSSMASAYISETTHTIGPDYPTEFYVEPAVLADPATRARLVESEEQSLDRRNRLLDHLIARFAERFADYALLTYRLSGDRVKTGAELIADKTDFLRDYPRLSRDRGQAANMRPENTADVWNSDNISGLERRVGRLVGIDDLTRRALHCAAHFDMLCSTRKVGGQYIATIRDTNNAHLFGSEEKFANADAALAALESAYPGLREEGAFEIAETQGATTFTLKIVSGTDALTHKSQFDSEADAVKAARAIIERYDELLASAPCDAEGMHLIEHILLRPREPGARLMQVCLPEECTFCGEEDPYSARVSVVLPYWPERFRNLHFRALFERMLREEAPAHVQVRICWISQAQMTQFDGIYRRWLGAHAADPIKPSLLQSRTAALIAMLENLKTIYPAASLHDCDDGEEENFVRLGSVALGIF